MFLGTLYPFQETHEANLLLKCSNNVEMVLSAPTGSGKTVLVCRFIDDFLDENPNTVFLWLCPGAGGLEKQSQDSFEDLVSGIQDGDVYDFMNESDPRGKVYFINWDKINKSSNVVLREGEQKDLMEKVADCHRNGTNIFMLIDEEHKYQETANRFVDLIVPSHVLRISATPTTQSQATEVIPDDEVISAGLIASSISINEGVSKAIEENNNLDDDLLLIDLADKKRKSIQDDYDKRGLSIRPLVLIQFPNGSEEWIARVKEALANLGYGENSGLVTSWFSGDHPENPEEIKKLNGQYSFLLFKQAIATGWDCPRAKILVKLREGGTEIFNTQTIGRIRRMPERKHYDDELLDRCYVYTLDDEFQEGLTDSISDSFYSYLYKEVENPPYLGLPKEFLDGTDRFAANPKAVVEVLRKKFLSDCDANHDGKLTREEMANAKGFIFDTKLKTTALEGVARTTKDIKNLNRIFAGEHQINIHDDGFIIRDAKRKIASSLKIDESISSNALRILFDVQDKQMDLFETTEDSKYESDNKLIPDMSHREYCAFLVNNREKLVSMMSEINAKDIVDIEEAPTKSSEWHIPFEQYFKQHKKTSPNYFLKKNLYQKYGDNILVKPNRSTGEIEFEKWCESSPAVSWVYRNGDKGAEFFSVVYRMALRRANFYPDYIVILKNSDIWIIEVKGGQKADGETENIDLYAKNKFDALKDYVSKANISNLHFGFVRYMGSQLYLSNTEWVDDLNDRSHWLPIEDFIR
jgi:type III restriction enzyme